MELDVQRKLIIGAVDPRHDDVDQESCPGIGQLGSKTRNPNCRSGFYVISYADPEHLKQIGDMVELPVGHTTSCIDDCNYVWTGGPARRNDLAYLGPFTPGARGDGRPIWVTNLKDPAHPEVYPKPIDLGRNDGLTDYSHDVDVDGNGIAWISGRGGLTGYATTRALARPEDRQGPSRQAVGSGARRGRRHPRRQTTASRSRRRTSSTTRRGPPTGRCTASGVADDNVVLMTEEDFTTPCDQGGRIVAADITSSLGGEGETNSTPEDPFRMTTLSSFHPKRNASGFGGAERRLLRALLRGEGRRAGSGVVRPGAAPDRRDRRSQPAPGGLLLRGRDGRSDEPDVAVVGHRVARQPTCSCST